MAGDLPEYSVWSHPIDDVGGCFALGSAGGAAFHFVRGLIRGAGGSPGSRGDRLLSGIRAASANAPRVGGRLVVWCVAISSIEYAAYRAQGVEYPISAPPCKEGAEERIGVPVAAGLTFFGLLGMRRGGLPVAARYALGFAASMVAVLEAYRYDRLETGARCLRRNQMKGGKRPAPVDHCPSAPRPAPNFVQDVLFLQRN